MTLSRVLMSVKRGTEEMNVAGWQKTTEVGRNGGAEGCLERSAKGDNIFQSFG